MFSCWAESIFDNRKADVMGLYSLCMLTKVHAWIHLHDGQIWSTLADDKLNHDTAMERCEIHLAYLGRGLYVSLHPHKLEMRTSPDQSLDMAMDVKPVVIGELTSNESLTLDKLIKFGLGVGIDHTCVVKIKEEIESDTELDKTSADHTPTVNKDKGLKHHMAQREQFNLKECIIKILNLKLKDKGPFKLTPEFLKEHTSNDNQDVYSSSDETIIYWQESPVNSKGDANVDDKPFTLVPLKQMRKRKLRHSELKLQKCHVICSRPSKFKGGFKITLHGIARRQPKYYFRCYIHHCNSKFHSLKEWNSHHLLQHKSLLLCLKCPKQFKKPSAFRVHQNNHTPAKPNCSICGKTFAFPSSVQLH